MKNIIISLPAMLIILITACTLQQDNNETVDNNKWLTKIDSLEKEGFNITDYHAHLKGGLTIDELILYSEKTGIDYGVAINCGKGFPVHNDSALSAWYHSMKEHPVYLAVQAEGREWLNLVSRDTVALFDYVFTDAMTFTDWEGRRVRLWIKDEVFIDDTGKFMEYYVDQIEKIVSTEPIDIYVNPTYLPDTLKKDYDALWTPERMDRVVKVLKDNKVALEINSKTRLPSPAFIKKAKKAGVKFTMGTNNRNRDLGYLAYGLQMIDECELQPDDFLVIEKSR